MFLVCCTSNNCDGSFPSTLRSSSYTAQEDGLLLIRHSVERLASQSHDFARDRLQSDLGSRVDCLHHVSGLRVMVGLCCREKRRGEPRQQDGAVVDSRMGGLKVLASSTTSLPLTDRDATVAFLLCM